MTPTDLIEERSGATDSLFLEPSRWRTLDANTYEWRALVCPEAEGGFSVHALRLPGVVSQGETVEEALANIAEAFSAIVASYLDDGEDIPWCNVEIERTEGCKERWILVNV